MYRKVGMLFCTNAMLAGVASSFVFAQKDVYVEDAKKLASGEDLVSGNIGDFEANKKDIEQINKKIVLVYSLVALGILSLVVGVAIVVRLLYLKNKRIKAIDKAWDNAGFGVAYVGVSVEENNKFSNCKTDDKKMNFLADLWQRRPDLLEAVVRYNLEDAYKTILKEKKFRNSGDWSLKSADEIKKILREERKTLDAKEQDFYNKLEKSGIYNNSERLEIVNKKEWLKELEEALKKIEKFGEILLKASNSVDKKVRLFEKFEKNSLSEKLGKLENWDIFSKIMGCELL